jgi:putative transcriptional regulator
MSEYNDIMEGINQAIEYEKGNLEGVRKRLVVVSPVPKYKSFEIKKIRHDLKVSQSVFAGLLGVSLKTIEAWESGKNIPAGPAQRMLELFQKDPTKINDYLEIKQN